MQRAVRNLGRDRDSPRPRSRRSTRRLWDLKAKLLGLPLATLLGRVARRRADLRQRRLHHLHRRATARPARRLGRARWLPLGQDEDRHRARARSAPRRAWRRARDRRARGCSSTPTAPSRSSRRCALAERLRREADVALVRGAGLVRRSRRACALVRERAPAAWTSPPANTATTSTISAACSSAGAVDVLQADATRCGGYHRLSAGRARLCEAHHIDLSGHCAPALHLPCRLRGAAPAPSRMVSRSRPHRAHAVRRRARAAAMA